MRIIAVTCVPLFLLGVLEICLRSAGYGHATRYFIPREIGGVDYLIPNRKFTHLFFPPALARDPLPFRMPAGKAEQTYRIFLFGESAAYGDPDPSFGMGRFLEALLELRYPGTDFEIVCVAMTAINSHVILPIARDCVKYSGDLWIIYMGNNEMVGPFGAGTIFGKKAPTRDFVKALLLIKSTRVGQLMSNLLGASGSRSGMPESWGGIGMFRKNKLGHDDPGRLKAYENFKGNLDEIITTAHRADIPVILSTVASNLKDCAPFSSLHSGDLGAELAAWEDHFEDGIEHEKKGFFDVALGEYGNAGSIDSAYAELHYRVGKCLLALDRNEEALEAFKRARDYDALAVRADTRINRIILETSDRHKGRNLTIVDAASELADQTVRGISGRETFYEHVHFTVEGNFRMGRLLADRVAGKLPSGIVASEEIRDGATEFKACAHRLAFSLWDEKRVWNLAMGRISVPPFTSQSSHESAVEYFKEKMRDVDNRTNPSSWNEVIRLYESALEKYPNDTLVRWNYAQFLERSGYLSQAIDQGEQICIRLPHVAWPHYFVGSLMVKQGRPTGAVEYLRKALEIQPDIPNAAKELERVLRIQARGIN